MLKPRPRNIQDFKFKKEGTIKINSNFLIKDDQFLVMEDFYQTRVMYNDNENVAKIVRDKCWRDYEVVWMTLYVPREWE